jgi:superfamily II DNA helicase RecQ
MALTATATPKVRADIVASLHMARPALFEVSFFRSNLFLRCGGLGGCVGGGRPRQAGASCRL